MHSSKILALVACFAKLGMTLEAPVEGYEVVDLVWDVVTPGGESLTVTGSVQDVVAEITTIEPGFNVLENVAPVSVRRRTADDIFRRQNSDRRCGGPWPFCNAGRIQEGINYLRGVGGQPREGPGPGRCGRVSCSYNAAIWWCNDNNFEKVLYGFNAIANSAQYIKDGCTSGPNLVAGQNFERDGWNTIVREDRC
ncbi:hypothetical protein ACN47E_000898 [Coniothyrium glycines]